MTIAKTQTLAFETFSRGGRLMAAATSACNVSKRLIMNMSVHQDLYIRHLATFPLAITALDISLILTDFKAMDFEAEDFRAEDFKAEDFKAEDFKAKDFESRGF